MNQLNYWFKWNEVKSTDYGIYIAEQPNIIKPAERVSYITIPGRSGSLTQLQGEDVYEDITLTVECFISDGKSVNTCPEMEFLNWRRGRAVISVGVSPTRLISSKFCAVIRTGAFLSFGGLNPSGGQNCLQI